MLWPAAACLGAAPTSASSLISFNLPADEFPRAMLEFYRQAHVPVVFSSIQDLRSIHTRTVSGELEPVEALRRMLEGTPLTFIIDPDGVVIIKRGAGAPAQAAALPEARAADGSAQPASAAHVPAEGAAPLKVEEVRVTGSLIHGEEGGAPLLTVTPRDIGAAAYPTIQDAFYQLPINSLSAPRQDLGTSFNYSWGAGLNLRGLGVGATLVLVDGQRQALSGYDGDFVDVSNIPAIIVDRVEVLPDGASALYGSDAIAGVVNIILRKDFEGAQSSVHVGSAIGGRRDVTASQIVGLHWSGGRAVLAYQYMDDTPLFASARLYAADADKEPLGGADYRSFYASPGNVLNPATAQPLGMPELQNPFAQSDLFPDIRQHNFYAHVSQDVTEQLQLFASARFAQRSTLSQQQPYQQVLDVPDSNPYYRVRGTGSGLVAYSFLSDLGPVRTGGVTDSYNGVLGADMDLGRGWHATLTGSLGGENLRLMSYDEPDQGQLTSALASPNAATAFDPFGATPPATLAAISREFPGHAATSLQEGSLIADGPLGDLPAGPVRLAVGVERREESLEHDVPDPANPMEATIPQSYSRNIQAAFTELSVPLVPGRQGVPAAPRVQLQLAGRYENYSDFGDTFNPSARLTWLASPWLKVRGSWGRSFRAPTLDDLHDSAQNGAGLTMLDDPAATSSKQSLVLVLQGDNPNLREETATTWTAGFDLTPAPGTQISLTYYDIAYQNQIAVPASGDPSSVLFDSTLWASVITRNPTAQQIASVCNARGEFQGSRAACLNSTPAAIIDLRLANLSSTLVKGLDLQAHQLFETAIGQLELGVAGSYLFQFAEGATGTSPEQSILDTVGNPMALRLRATLDWSELSGPYGLGAMLGYGYMSSYRDPGSLLAPEVASFGSFDLQVRYRWPQLELSVNAVNIFNQTPPFVDSPYGYDRFNTQPLGRVLGLSVAKTW